MSLVQGKTGTQVHTPRYHMGYTYRHFFWPARWIR
jgi:hypothetical protein